jgi:hypothetical protein
MRRFATPNPGGIMADSIEGKAESRLYESTYSELHHIECTFRHGILTLCGTVSTFFVRQIAQELIEDLEGIEIIDNQLVVVRDQTTPVAS